MALKFNCSNCGAELISYYLAKGEKYKCTGCGHEVEIPQDAVGIEMNPPVPAYPGSLRSAQMPEKASAKKRNINEKYPSFLQAVLLVILFILFTVIASLIWGFLFGFTFAIIGSDYDFTPIVSFLATLSAYIGIIIIGLRKTGRKTSDLPFYNSKVKPLILSVLISLMGMMILVFAISSLMDLSGYFSRQSEAFSDYIIEMFNKNPAIMFISLVIVAPVFEETIFRGIIFRGFLRRYSIKWSIILSSLLFGAVHLLPSRILLATLLGLFLGYLYYKVRFLSVCMIVHSFVNSVGFCILAFFALTGRDPNKYQISDISQIIIAVLAAILGAIILLLGIRRFNRNMKKISHSELEVGITSPTG